MLWKAVFLFSLFNFLVTLSHCEIHRARGIKPSSKFIARKLSPRSTWPPGPNIESIPPAPVDNFEEAYKPIKDGISAETRSSGFTVSHEREIHSKETWVYSLISACLVGLSGIFPLLVIPMESGKALKHGAPAARLKLLLSFAVGGLLGDVFLHLLPESWAHLQGYQSHKNAGLWVILGLCSFLIIEKIFPEDEQEEAEEEVEFKEEGATDITSKCHQHMNGTTTQENAEIKSGYSLRPRQRTNNPHIDQILDEQNSHTIKKNNAIGTNGIHKNGVHTLQNGVILQNGTNSVLAHQTMKSNSESNGHILAAENVNSHLVSQNQESHIKTSGWLNLMANMIDNFTHGLAVAGSYCVSTKVGMLTTFAILLHEIPHEVGDFAILLKAGFDRWKAAKAQLLTATGGIFGALCALMADSVQEAGNRTAWILPFTSGGFIYIAMVTVVPDLIKEKNDRESVKQLLFLGLGIVVMAMVTLLH